MKDSKGFTLVELMIVVVILGILAAIAIPAFIKYVRSSKTSEARENLAYLFRESGSYYAAERVNRGMAGGAILARFPVTQALTPAAIPAGIKVTTTTWDTSPTWVALKFSIPDPHYFSYQYTSAGTGSTAAFSATAFGDLDGDTLPSTFERAGRANAQSEVEGSAGLYELNTTE